MAAITKRRSCQTEFLRCSAEVQVFGYSSKDFKTEILHDSILASIQPPLPLLLPSRPNLVFRKISELTTSSGAGAKLRILYPYQTTHIPILGTVLVEQTSLISTEHGFVNANGSHLLFVYVADVHPEIEAVPGGFHAAVSEKETIDIVGLGAPQLFSTGDFVPFGDRSRPEAGRKLSHDRARRAREPLRAVVAGTGPISARFTASWFVL